MEKPTTELLNILNHTGTGEMDDFIENYGKTDMIMLFSRSIWHSRT